MLVVAALSFAAGIYLNALQAVPLKYSLVPLILSILCLPFVIQKTLWISIILILLSFLLAGMVRLEMTTISHSASETQGGKEFYEGLVIESSPRTKIVRLRNPAAVRSLKVMIRTSDTMNVNDTVKAFGELKELTPTFKNPHVLSWSWLKKLEGTSHELRGMIVSRAPGNHPVHAVRNSVMQKIEASGMKHSGIMKAITVGDSTAVDADTRQLFLHTGTSHILAISGFHLGIVTAFVFGLFRYIIGRKGSLRLRGDDSRYAAVATIPIAAAFMLVAGSSIPTVRATIMITVFMLSVFFERKRSILSTLALSALLILLLYPHSLFTPSFQLTFASVAAIILFTKRIVPRIKTKNKLLKWLALSIGITVSATVGTLPIVLYHFYGFNPVSAFHNMVAVPLMCGVAMPLGLLGAFLPWGHYALHLAGEVVGLTLTVLAVLDWGYIYPVIRPNLIEVLLYFTVLLSILYVKKKLVKAFALLVLLPAVFGYACLVYCDRFNNDLKVTAVDVGNGDAFVVEAPRGMRMLIDGGGFDKANFDVGKAVLTPVLLSKKIRTLDYVINTHPHADHLGGILTILRDFHVRNFSTGSYFIKQEMFVDVLRFLKEKRIPMMIWKQGDRMVLDNGLEISVLHPRPDTTTEDLNEASLVMKISFGSFSVLFTGDVSSSIEEELLKADIDLRATVLKVPHHGSRFSSSQSFLSAVRPSLAVLSVGAGMAGIPSRETLNRYERLSIPVLRTDRHGMIRVWKNTRGITYVTYRK